MKLNKYISATLFFAAAGMFQACTNDFLQLEPLDSETEAVYFKTPADFQAAADNLHTNVYAWNEFYNLHADYGTDLVTIGSDMVNGTNTPDTSDKYYEQEYKWLRTANQLIQKAEGFSDKESIAIPWGQALFFRAWHHFSLLQRFGGVPLMLEVPDVNSEVVIGARKSRYEVIKSIIDDLDLAIEKLKNCTVASVNNDGHVTCDAAKAFKARVCLFEGTWEKYNGIGSADATNGDGSNSGAGTATPAGYPSVTEFLTMAKNLSDEIISSGTYELFLGVEQAPTSANPDQYAHTSYFYLFNLEGSDSNPAGKSKADNKESIFRSVYDHNNRISNTNLTHTVPARMTRKLIDMYLCIDGLPVHVSPLFKGYKDMNAEFENRDYRLLACHPRTLQYVWGYGMYNIGADYSVDIYSLPASQYQYCPNLLSKATGTHGRKFCTELATVLSAGQEAADFMHIRLAEMYLVYAEATAELNNGNISDEDLNKSLNIVRARGGVAPLNAALIAQAQGLGCQMSYLGEIRRERATELYGEGFRMADACRWGKAEKIFGDETCGAYITINGENTYLVDMINPVTGEKVYNPTAYEGNILTNDITYEDPAYSSTKAGAIIVTSKPNRKFAKKNYLQPIPTAQIQLNSNLTQNPGW